MFELAARLVGVYKVNHMTKSVTIENRDYIVRRGGHQQQHAQQRGLGGGGAAVGAGVGETTQLVMRPGSGDSGNGVPTVA
jgi:hypothetical protein